MSDTVRHAHGQARLTQEVPIENLLHEHHLHLVAGQLVMGLEPFKEIWVCWRTLGSTAGPSHWRNNASTPEPRSDVKCYEAGIESRRIDDPDQIESQKPGRHPLRAPRCQDRGCNCGSQQDDNHQSRSRIVESKEDR